MFLFELLFSVFQYVYTSKFCGIQKKKVSIFSILGLIRSRIRFRIEMLNIYPCVSRKNVAEPVPNPDAQHKYLDQL